MRPLTNTPVFIVSAEQSTKFDYLNIVNTGKLAKRLAVCDIPHKSVRGSYKGRPVRAFVVKCDEEVALELAREFGQESILFVDPTRTATLIYSSNGQHWHLGQLTECSEEQAKCGDYTYDPIQNAYYHVVCDV